VEVKQEQVLQPSARDDVTVTSASIREESGSVLTVEETSGCREASIAESYESYTPDFEPVVEDSIPSPKTDAVVVEESLSPRNISLAEVQTATGTGTSLQPIDESSGVRVEDLNENTDKVSNLLFIYAYRFICIPMLFKKRHRI
jgi:hypothetical protein